MMTRWTVLALGAAMLFTSPSLMAEKDKNKEKHKGNPHGYKHHDEADDREWQHRGGYEYREYDRDGRPPGWSQGKKTGWGNCGLPPGQAKKYGCRTYMYEGRPHYYYQDDAGRIIVRRPMIEVHGSVNIVR